MTGIRFLKNAHRGRDLANRPDFEPGDIVKDASVVQALMALCPKSSTTPLVDMPDLATRFGVGALHFKDERARMGLGSFKALGAAFAIAKMAASRAPDTFQSDPAAALTGTTFVCASAGNHGLSVAAGAAVFGADAVVYLAETVPEAFADRLRGKGARVVRRGAIYEDAMEAAQHAANAHGWNLLSDSSWLGYSDPARDVMEGYLIMGAEVAEQLDEPPTHVFLQAGVGGLAAACAASARAHWGADVKICVVEPDRAPALLASIAAGSPAVADGPESNMGRLDCKEPSHLALRYLAREADAFATVSDEEAASTVALLDGHGMGSTPSGVAGLAGLVHVSEAREALGIDSTSKVLIYISEAAADA